MACASWCPRRRRRSADRRRREPVEPVEHRRTRVAAQRRQVVAEHPAARVAGERSQRAVRGPRRETLDAVAVAEQRRVHPGPVDALVDPAGTAAGPGKPTTQNEPSMPTGPSGSARAGTAAGSRRRRRAARAATRPRRGARSRGRPRRGGLASTILNRFGRNDPDSATKSTNTPSRTRKPGSVGPPWNGSRSQIASATWRLVSARPASASPPSRCRRSCWPSGSPARPGRPPRSGRSAVRGLGERRRPVAGRRVRPASTTPSRTSRVGRDPSMRRRPRTPSSGAGSVRPPGRRPACAPPPGHPEQCVTRPVELGRIAELVVRAAPGPPAAARRSVTSPAPGPRLNASRGSTDSRSRPRGRRSTARPRARAAVGSAPRRRSASITVGRPPPRGQVVVESQMVTQPGVADGSGERAAHLQRGRGLGPCAVVRRHPPAAAAAAPWRARARTGSQSSPGRRPPPGRRSRRRARRR